jgi:hypothetical protein
LGNFIQLRREWQKSAQNEKSSPCASFVSELELLQKLFDRHLMMRGDIFEDPGQGADLDRVMVGNILASKLSLEVGRQVDRIRKDKWR